MLRGVDDYELALFQITEGICQLFVCISYKKFSFNTNIVG